MRGAAHELDWEWGGAEHAVVEHAGRRCLRLAGPGVLVSLRGLAAKAGTYRVEVAVPDARTFHGVAWRIADPARHESFFVRPHQVGNPDAVQYTPVFNGLSSWQLYHGEGFWRETLFPLGEWFPIEVVFDGDRAEITVADAPEPTLVTRLRLPPQAGAIGVLAGGDDLHVGTVAYDETVSFRAPPPPEPAAVDGAIREWWVSTPFREGEAPDPDALDWTRLEAEPSGLVDLSRAHAIDGGRNTVYARAVLHAAGQTTARLELGFSDRTLISLNRRPLYRGDATYRSRDYRFLGSIGWFDALYLPLEAGENELLVAVSEDFGGWGVQARIQAE